MPPGRTCTSWLTALVVCAVAVVPSACSSSAAVYNCDINYARVEGSGQDEGLSSCAGVVGIRGLDPVRLQPNHSVRVIVPNGLAVTLSTSTADIVTIDGLRIIARHPGGVAITQTGLNCGTTKRCVLLRVIVG